MWRPATGHLCDNVRETANWWPRVLFSLTPPSAHSPSFSWGERMQVERGVSDGDKHMKLYLFFVLMDTMILLAYPIVFIVSKLRRNAKNKQ
jgi:hypothetical protein